jgi:hypothetical protein
MKLKRISKATIVFAACLLAIGPSLWAAGPASERYEEKFEKVESLERDGKVSLSNISGKIEIQVWNQAQVRIEAMKIARASSTDKAKENAALVKIDVSKTGNILQIQTKYPDRPKDINVSVNYSLWIPDKASIKVKSVSGDVTAQGIGGTFEGNITSGDAVLSKMAGGVDCRTVSGEIEVEDVTSDVDAKVVSGDIRASRIKGSVEAETTSGLIRLRDISEAKTVRAKVLSGGISYEGQVYAGGKYNLETLSGSIEMVLPANSAFELDAEAFSGTVNTDFEITMSGKLSRREVRGVVNNGGASIRLKTFSGNIRLRKG